MPCSGCSVMHEWIPINKKKKKKKKKLGKGKPKKKKKKKNHISGGTFKAPKASYISYISLKKVIFFKRNFIIIVSIFSIKWIKQY